MLMPAKSSDHSEFETQSMLYPEIAGKRVFIAGVTNIFGVDIARMFAEAGAKLTLQFDEDSLEMAAVAEMLAPVAPSLAARHGAFRSVDAIVQFARGAIADMGGVDIVINIVRLDAASDLSGCDAATIEQKVSDLLTPACLISRIAANRMRLTLTQGLVLSLASVSQTATAPERAFASIAKSALSTMTRREALAWADQGIRFNAVAPETQGVTGGLTDELDVAALALYLASGRGATLSGHTFEAEPLASV